MLFVIVKLKKSLFLFVLPINFAVLLTCQSVFGQETSKINNSAKLEAELVDVLQRNNLTSEDADARVDSFNDQLSKNPGSSAFIILYCGKVCRYGEVEAHFRGIEATLTYKKLNKKRFTIISGGFREQFTTEFWLVRENACPPVINSTVNIREVRFKGMLKRKTVVYHFNDGPDI